MTSAAAALATPIRVRTVDVESTDRLDLDDHGPVWLVLRRSGAPRVLLELDPADPADRQRARVAMDALRAEPGAELPPIPAHLLPPVSVVVPTVVGRTAALARCLDALEHECRPIDEVVLVDNRRHLPAEDPLPGIVAGRPRVRVVRQPVPGISAARNAGVGAAAHDIVAFTDDDVQVDPGWLAAIVTRFARHPDVQAVTGLVLPADLETPAQLMFERYYGGFAAERRFVPLSYGAAGRTLAGRARMVAVDDQDNEVLRRPIYGVGVCGAGCNMAFRRTAFTGPAPFDTALGVGTPAQGGEDLVALIGVLWRGGRIGYEPAAVVRHEHRREYHELEKQMSGYGCGFTAMLAALVLREPGHLVGLAAQLAPALGRLVRTVLRRLTGRGPGEMPSFPGELARLELLGYLRGPGAYLAARRAMRRWAG